MDERLATKDEKGACICERASRNHKKSTRGERNRVEANLFSWLHAWLHGGTGSRLQNMRKSDRGFTCMCVSEFI